MPKRGKGQSRKSPGNKAKRKTDPKKMARTILTGMQQPIDGNSPAGLRALAAEQAKAREREASSQTPQRHGSGLVVPRPRPIGQERSDG
jgi:hypothetical protein